MSLSGKNRSDLGNPAKPGPCPKCQDMAQQILNEPVKLFGFAPIGSFRFELMLYRAIKNITQLNAMADPAKSTKQ